MNKNPLLNLNFLRDLYTNKNKNIAVKIIAYN
jgi:hypothetical protein